MSVVYFIVGAFFLYMILDLLFTEPEKPAPPEKSKEDKQRIVVECIQGGNIEEIAKREGISPDDIKKWQKDYFGNLIESAESIQMFINNYKNE